MFQCQTTPGNHQLIRGILFPAALLLLPCAMAAGPNRSVNGGFQTGQYVRIDIPGAGKILSLAEVQVFSGGGKSDSWAWCKWPPQMDIQNYIRTCLADGSDKGKRLGVDELLVLRRQPERHCAAVRAVLGHFIFVFIHPFPDGNGRIARFLMNAMLASGGYPWTIVRVGQRSQYMESLEEASVNRDISPFTKFVAKEMALTWSAEIAKAKRKP